jgi:hypothetical protein
MWADTRLGHPDIFAGIADTVSAVAERPAARQSAPAPTIVRGTLSLHPADDNRGPATALLDAAGRQVMSLNPGPNDITALRSGVYFVAVAGQRPVRLIKVR